MTDDAVIEKTAQVIYESRRSTAFHEWPDWNEVPAKDQIKTQCFKDAQAALAALEAGDDLGGGLGVRTLELVHKQCDAARAEEREAIAARLEKDAETFTEPTKTVLLVKAAAIRGRKDD